MDPTTFDRLVAETARHPSRRAALCLLAGGLIGGLVASRGSPARAQRADSDGDGLFDDDEIGVYGTDPGFYDSDGDGFGDGEEVYYGTNPLVVDGAVTADGNDVGATDPGPAGTIGGGDTGEASATDGGFGDGAASGNGGVAIGDVYNGGNVPPGTIGVGDTGSVACAIVGAYCDFDAQCCNGGAGVNCCFDSVSLRTRCEDITARGACLEQ